MMMVAEEKFLLIECEWKIGGCGGGGRRRRRRRRQWRSWITRLNEGSQMLSGRPNNGRWRRLTSINYGHQFHVVRCGSHRAPQKKDPSEPKAEGGEGTRKTGKT